MIRTALLITLLFFAVGLQAQWTGPAIPPTAVTATAPASLRYADAGFFKRFLLGKNYRATWAAPVTLPVFHLKEMGYKISELGGGQQTKSLRLRDATGVEWALRTIDKDVEKAISEKLRHTLAQKVVQDMVSAANPYAPLVVPPIAAATGVVVASPVYYFVPDDTALGPYRALFKNTMCMLEAREPTPDGSETINAADMVHDLLQKKDMALDEPAILRARLLDMLIGDWDRHQDQWRFARTPGAKKTYYAIPRDRDQALFHSNGLIVKIARLLALKHLVGFAKNTKKLKQLNAKSWNFDRLFLAGLDAHQWRQIAMDFASALPDTLLQNAVRRFPPAAYAISGHEVSEKLVKRRRTLAHDVMKYYRLLALHVTIWGSDGDDRFVITPYRDSINVKRFAEGNATAAIYNRTFLRSETYDIKIYALGGDDVFESVGNATSRIRLQLDGGKGKNTYRLSKTRRLTFSDSDASTGDYLNDLKAQLKIKE